MHRIFEWDDAIAGEKWRQQQAKQMISNLRIEVQQEDAAGEPQTVVIRAYVNSEVDDSRTCAQYINSTIAFKPASTVMDTVIANAMRELNEFTRKYRIYSQFADVIAAIEQLWR